MPYGIPDSTWAHLSPEDRQAIIDDWNAGTPGAAGPTTPPPAPPPPPPSEPEPPDTVLVPPGMVRIIVPPNTILLPAPPVAEEPAPAPEPPPEELGPLPGWDFHDPFADEFFNVDQYTLRHQGAVDEMYSACDLYGIDALAAAANALHEGAGGGIGDSGTAYGPWQIHATDGRLPSFTGKGRNNPIVQAWAWSANGIDYAIRQMAVGGARGKRGHAAVHAIVYGFERPADMAGADATRKAEYDRLSDMGGAARAYLNGAFLGPTVGQGGNVPTVPVAPIQPGAQSAWRNVIDALKTTQPNAAAHVRAIAGELTGIAGGSGRLSVGTPITGEQPPSDGLISLE